jgi:hypothetical protein
MTPNLLHEVALQRHADDLRAAAHRRLVAQTRTRGRRFSRTPAIKTAAN